MALYECFYFIYWTAKDNVLFIELSTLEIKLFPEDNQMIATISIFRKMYKLLLLTQQVQFKLTASRTLKDKI